MRATGNTIFIPGATSGLGLGLALRFHAAGNTVIVGGRRQDLLDQVVAEHEGIEAVRVDVTDPASIAHAHRSLTTSHPELNVVITMAGVMVPEDVLSEDAPAIAESTVTTNLLGTIRLVHAFAPFLTGKDDAVIMTVSSGLAFVPLPATPTYSATKAAVHSFTDAVRVQLADTGVQVIELVPPATATTLMGMDQSPIAMPVEDFLTEVMTILTDEPDVTQVLVERVKRQRFAEATGTYDQMLTAQSAIR